MDDAYDLVGAVRKNATEEVRVALNEFHGSSLIDLRVFADLGDGERRPTKKGVALNVRALPELIEVLQRAEAEARRRGLISGGA
jgi:hypothetical protein